MPPRDILVVSDLSLASNEAVWRAGQLAGAHAAALRVLHVAGDAAQLAKAQASLARVTGSVSDRLAVRIEVDVVRGDLSREVARAVAGANLLVLPARDGSTMRERLSGTSTERLVRASRVPVLVVRRPVARSRDSAAVRPGRRDLYERVLVAVDLGPASEGAIAAATWVSDDPRMGVFHAVAPERSASVHAVKATLDGLVRDTGAAAAGARATVGFGHPAGAVLAKERALGAELIVLGSRQKRLWSAFSLGATTQEVLSGSRCDVLLVR